MRFTVGTTKISVVHLFGMVGLILLVLATIGRSHSSSRSNKPLPPAQLTLSCRLVLASVNGDGPIDKEISQQQKLIINGSQAVQNFERLGWAFIRKARSMFDPGYYKLAEQCALCMNSIKSETPEALLLRAHVAQSLHRFSEAETLASQLTRVRERPFDYGVLGDALIDQGKIRDAATAYQKMVDLRPDLQSYVRAAHVRWLTGDLKGAVDLMQLATSSSSPNDPNSGAWAYNRLALYRLQVGSIREAVRSCDAALGLQSDYAPAVLTRARILWTLNRADEALAQFKQAAELSPLPEYQWALADALRATDSVSANEVESHIKQSTEDPRTVSLYLSTRGEDVDRAVQLAEQELKNRQDVFTHDALAWALAASGRTTEARNEVDKALAEGTKDARLYLHAAVIAAQNGQNSQARRWIEQAYATQQMLFPSERTLLQTWRKRILTSKAVRGSNSRSQQSTFTRSEF
ncbi:MAG TPA: tetratricopeptide repeat protein [Pyrinomonadaceae bacterium]